MPWSTSTLGQDRRRELGFPPPLAWFGPDRLALLSELDPCWIYLFLDDWDSAKLPLTLSSHFLIGIHGLTYCYEINALSPI